MQINISIQADTQEEYQEAIKTLAAGLGDADETSSIKPKPEPVQETEKKAESKPEVFSKNSYFHNTDDGGLLVFKKGDEIPNGIYELNAISKKEYDSLLKKQKEETAAEKKTEKSAASTGLTSDTEQLKTGEQVGPIEKEDVENSVSATQGKYPNATKKDVVKAMQEAQVAGKLSAVKTALGRFNATKISELEEEHFSAFLTDLEVLVKG